MTGPLPVGFFAALGGATLGGGAVLAAAWRWARRASLRRVRTAATDARASAIVEFPFALLALIVISLLTWQFALMASAYVVVDYAAYVAARCAIVTIPEDRSEDDEDEEANKLSEDDSSPKRDDIREAAMFACYPIAGILTGGDGDGDFYLWKDALEAVEDIPGLGDVVLAGERYAYLRENTKVVFVEDAFPEDGEYEAGDVAHVRVEHQFQLRVPFASRIFGSEHLFWGYRTSIDGEATMLVEAYGEEEPDGADPDEAAE